MNLKTFFFLFLPLVSFCFSSDKNGYQKIILDDHHNSAKSAAIKDKTVVNYKIKAAPGIILDCSKYDFTYIKSFNGGKDPDKVHIVCKSGTFDFRLNLHGETIIDNTTAEPLGEQKHFSGFQKNEGVIIAVGTLAINGTTAEMVTWWVGTMDVE